VKLQDHEMVIKGNKDSQAQREEKKALPSWRDEGRKSVKNVVLFVLQFPQCCLEELIFSSYIGPIQIISLVSLNLPC